LFCKKNIIKKRETGKEKRQEGAIKTLANSTAKKKTRREIKKKGTRKAPRAQVFVEEKFDEMGKIDTVVKVCPHLTTEPRCMTEGE